MSRSFDDIFKDRLGGFEKKPPMDAKQAVLAHAPGSGLVLDTYYQILAAAFLLLSFYQIGRVQQPDTSITQAGPSTPQELIVSRAKPEQSVAVVNPENLSEAKATSTDQRKGVVVKKGSTLKNSTEEEEPLLELSGEMHSLDGCEVDLFETEAYRFNGLSLASTRKIRKRIVPEKKKAFQSYFNTGAFFVYNRVKPNLADDIYVGEYESPFGISPARIGLALEGGIHKQWNSKIASRFGLSFNNFNQSYSFSVRASKPDSVSVNNETGFLEPHFDKEHVRINKRVAVVGVKAQMFWYLFPSYTNVLFTSFEYQYLIGKGPEFNYKDKSYALMKPSQFLAEFGLRKLLFEKKNSDLFLMPSIRYSLGSNPQDDILSVKPFSVGVTLSYGLK